MPRFVVMESLSGDLYGDTARFGPQARDVACAADAALLIDRSRGRGKRGFGFVRKHSPSASLDVYRIAERDGVIVPPARTTAEAEALIRNHGEFVTSLITYNS